MSNGQTFQCYRCRKTFDLYMREAVEVSIKIEGTGAMEVCRDLCPNCSMLTVAAMLNNKQFFPTEVEDCVHFISQYDPEGANCRDCGVSVGEQHTPGCDQERCPVCLGQLISCGHDVQALDDLFNKEKTDV